MSALTSQISPDENFEFQDESSLQHYFTQIPNIVFEMGLSPFQFTAYSVFKRTAGSKGVCFKTNVTLAREIGCSIRMLVDIKKQLVEFGLITQLKRTDKKGGSLPDLIQIVDIWHKNMMEMIKKYPKNQTTLTFEMKAPNNFYGHAGRAGGGVHHMQGGGAPHAHKEEHIEEDIVVVVKEGSRKKEMEPEKKPKEQSKPQQPSFNKDDLYHLAIRMKKDWLPPEMEEAWTIYHNSSYPVTDPFAFIEGIIKKNRNKKVIQHQKVIEKCRNQKTQQNRKNQRPSRIECVKSNENCSEKDTSVRVSLGSICQRLTE